MTDRLPYWDWIREQAALHNVDGCTGVTNWNAKCCLQHDLEFRTGKWAASAYRWYRTGHPDPWAQADAITFEQANANFKNCNFREGVAGYFNPLAWLRFAAMKLRKTRKAWDSHRQREASDD